MASGHSTDDTRLRKHDVFLSFRGADTRNSFVSFLHRDLVAKNGIETYIDYRLGGGEEIEPVLLEKIQESLISIVIFSKNYADSTFCLRELSKILQCKKTKDQIVIPVFYHVDPTDIQELRGSFAEGLAKLEGECNSEEVDSWRHALREIANLKGWDSNVIKPDNILVESIVDDVQKKLRHMPLEGLLSNGSKSLVGIDSRINELESILCMESTEVIVVGIWGMPGIGKTTIAGAVYGRISHLFDSSCFFNNVREVSQKEGLLHVRNQILCQVLEKKDLKNMSESDIKRMLQRKKILVVLDDVSSHQQLEETLGENCLLRRGSRIIMTSRDKQLLENCCDKTYRVTELGFVEAFQLFKLHAFKGVQCPEGFKELSERAVNYCKGNPLSLRVLGSNLYNERIKEWVAVLANLKETLDPEILKILKMSYDGLDWKQKRIFLDIACFFKRWDRDLVQQTLDCCGFNAKIGIDRLVDLCLLNISENNEIWMHDLLQQLGEDIVHEENFDDPRKRSRLWTTEDIKHVLRHNKGTETIQTISLNMKEINKMHLSPSTFEEMCNLRFLEFYFPPSQFICFQKPELLLESLTFLPTKLRILRWDYYPLKSLPSNFSPDYLIQLRLFHADGLERLWDTVPLSLGNLKVLQIIWAAFLKSVNPFLSAAPNLMILNLEMCLSLRAIDLSNVPNLKVLNLTGCVCITHIDLLNLPKLEDLCLSSCQNLIEVPNSIGMCSKLITLDLSFGRSLTSLPNSIGSLVSLTKLLLQLTNICSIPASIKQLSKLSELSLDGCERLECLPELPPSLQHINWRELEPRLRRSSYLSVRAKWLA